MSWSAETTKKLNRSGLDFLVLVLQNSNSLNLNAFFNQASVYFFLLTYFQFSCCPGSLVFPLFCSPCQDWIIWFFFVPKSSKFPRQNPCFRKVLHFFYWLGFEVAPARGSPASVSDHVMSGETTWKLNMSGLDFLVPVLQNSNSLHMKAFFIFASVYFFLLTWFQFSCCPGSLVFPLFCSPCQDWIIWFFFVPKSSNCFPVKTLVFERSFISFTDWVLNLRLCVVALPASVTMSWSAETTKKLNRSGLDFLVLVLQNSNSFNLNAFFSFASVNFFLATCSCSVFAFGVFCFLCFVLHAKTGFFDFFWSEILKMFSR